jgi:hypothetical protein
VFASTSIQHIAIKTKRNTQRKTSYLSGVFLIRPKEKVRTETNPEQPFEPSNEP